MLLLAGAPPLAAAGCALEASAVRAVTHVIDAETLRLDDRSEVRLAGILAPRPPDAAEDTSFWPPATEARAALEAMVAGRTVEIGFAGPRQDRYGRSVAHVFVVGQGRREWVQGALLAAGHARTFQLGDGACLEELLSHERLAFAAGRGLWASAAYQVRSAAAIGELMRYRHTLQLVEGEVVDVAEVRGRIYLNFGDSWRTDFTAGIERPRATGWPADLKALKGERVRVRGFIERRNGPYVDLQHPAQLEVLAATPEPPAASSRRSRRRAPAE